VPRGDHSRAIRRRNTPPPDGSLVLELLLRRQRAGSVAVAAAANPARIAAEAQALEDMDEPDHARNAWLDLAVTALARAELVRR